MQRTDSAVSSLPTDTLLTTPGAELSTLLSALQRMKEGDFSVRLPGNWVGLNGKIADTFNEIVASNERIAEELRRVGQAVGRDGKIRQRVEFGRLPGAWRDMEGSVNTLIEDLIY